MGAGLPPGSLNDHEAEKRLDTREGDRPIPAFSRKKPMHEVGR